MKIRSRKQGIVWGSLLTLLGAVLFVETFTDLTAWVWVAALAAGGLISFAVFLADRSDWGFLIPAYVLWAIAGLITLATLDVLQGKIVAPYVLGAIALPFLVVFLRNRAQWWALIPAYTLLAVGLMVMLLEQEVLGDLLVPAYVMFAIALPFFVVYARNTRHWWALIPGGVLAVIGLSFLIAENAVQYVGGAVLLLVGVWILVRQLVRRGPAKPDASAGPEDDQGL